MSILNVLLAPDHLVVAVDTLAEDAQTGAHSSGAKLLLIPQHNLVLATRGSAQFFLRIYELALQASFRADCRRSSADRVPPAGPSRHQGPRGNMKLAGWGGGGGL